jgi:pyrroline-5-carboxylate reductase
MKDLRVAFAGGGNMARAMIAGLLRAGVAPANVQVGEPLAEQRERLARELGVRVTADNALAVSDAAVVIVAVKPQEMSVVLQQLRPAMGKAPPLLLSIAAGIRVASLQKWCPGCQVVRAMPNRPALIGAGATALYAPPDVDAQQRALAESIMRTCGHTAWVRDENTLDVVTALSGSGPAYFFLLAEQMAAAATSLGLDTATAKALAAETLYGAGQLAHQDGNLANQRAAVTSKGGTTEAALAILNSAAVSQTVTAALTAAAERSAELARQFGG